MSVSILLNTERSEWKKFAINTLNANDINTVNIDTNTINNLPIPSGGIDPNSANIIYRPGSVNPSDSNVVSTWAEVVAKADNINVNECLNVYIDNSIVDPAPIDQSLDCKGRVRLLSHTYSAGAFTNARIIDGVTLTNPREISGTIGIECVSLTSPNIILSDGSILIVREGAFLTNSSSSLVPSLQIGDGNINVFSVGLGGRMGKSAVGVPLINIGIGSTLVFNNVLDTTGQTYIADSISSTDGTGNIILIVDASVDVALFVNSGFTGNVTQQIVDKALNVDYNDSAQLPASGSTNVQGCLDYLKTQIGAGSAPSDIIYRPSGVTGGNVFSLWSEVLTASSAVNNLVNIYFDDSLVVPLPCSIDQSHDFEGCATFNALNNNPVPSSHIIVQIENDVQIKNVKGCYGFMKLISDNQNGKATMIWDNGAESFEIYRCKLDSTAGSTGAYIDVPVLLQIQLFNLAEINSTGSLAISMQPNAFLYISLQFGSILQSNVISGTIGTLYIAGDASQNQQSQSFTFLSPYITNNVDTSEFIQYNDGLQLPSFGTFAIPVDTAQKAFDTIKKQITTITYRQNTPKTGAVYGEWADILDLCNSNSGEIMIYMDNGTFGRCEINQSYDFQGRVSFHSVNNSLIETNVRILDNVLITNLKSINGTMVLDCRNASGNPSLAFTNQNNLFINDWARCTNANGNGVALNVPNGGSLEMQLSNYCSINTNPSHPFINVGIGSTLAISLFNVSSVETNAIKSTDATATLNPYYDAGSNINTHAGFTGTLSNSQLADFAGNVAYTDTIPLLNSNNVQSAIDALKGIIGTAKPAFNVSTQTKTNVTGDGTQYVVLFDLIDNDPMSLYNPSNGIFTVPTTGTYVITSNLIVGNFDPSQTKGSYKLIGTGPVIHDLVEINAYPIGFASPGGNINMRLSKVVYLTAGTELYCELFISGGGLTVNISVGAVADTYCYFSASML